MPVPTAETTEQTLLEAASRLSGTRIGVAGDFGADIFIYGKPGRLSREAPVPILDYEDRCTVPGMAGNVVRNLSALGAKVTCAGILGHDDAGRRVKQKLNRKKNNSDGLMLAEGRHTCTKTRIMAGGNQRPKQQMVRLDRRDAEPFPADTHQRLLEAIEDTVEELDALIISDYGLGTVGEGLIERVPRWAEETDVVVDSRYPLKKFRGATAATPNQGEFEDCVNRKLDDEAEVADAASDLRERLQMEALLVTRGNEGMLLSPSKNEPVSFPIVGREDVTDVTGAGDTVVAAFALACGAGADYATAAFLATHAAAVVVTKPRTATCDNKELCQSITDAHVHR